MLRRTLTILFIAMFSISQARPNDIDPVALDAAEQLANSIEDFPSIEAKFKRYTGITKDVEAKIKAVRKYTGKAQGAEGFVLNGIWYELDLLGKYSYDGAKERLDFDNVSVVNGTISWQKQNVVSFDGKKIFGYDYRHNSGRVYTSEINSFNSLAHFGTFGCFLGKRVLDTDVDLLDLLRNAKELRTTADSEKSIAIEAVSDAVYLDNPIDVKVSVTLRKDFGYLPQAWSVGFNDFRIRIKTYEASAWKNWNGLWLPEKFTLNQYNSGGPDNEYLFTSSYYLVDARSVQLNLPYAHNYFTLDVPPGGKMLNELTDELMLPASSTEVGRSSLIVKFVAVVAVLVSLGVFAYRRK